MKGEPIRPRYVVSSLSGYVTAAGNNGGLGYGERRKPLTTWGVHDCLLGYRQQGEDFYREEEAEALREELEGEWEHYLEGLGL